MSLLLSLNDDVIEHITAKLSATNINSLKAVNKRLRARGRRVLQTHAKFAARRAAYRLEGHMGDMLNDNNWDFTHQIAQYKEFVGSFLDDPAAGMEAVQDWEDGLCVLFLFTETMIAVDADPYGVYIEDFFEEDPEGGPLKVLAEDGAEFMRKLFEGVLRWDDEIALAPPKGSKPSAPTDMYACGTSGVPFFDVLRYLQAKDISTYEILKPAVAAMKQCSSPARAARLLDAFSRFEEWCDAFTIDNEPHTAAEFVSNVVVLTEEWEPQQVAQLLHHSCLEVGGAGGILDGMMHRLTHLVAPDIHRSARNCASVLRELGADGEEGAKKILAAVAHII